MPQKSYQDLELLAVNTNVLNLSNEVLNNNFGQGAGKISEVNLRLEKISAVSAGPR